MHRHSINTASFFTDIIVALIFSLSLAGVAAGQQGNTSLGTGALQNNTTGSAVSPPGVNAPLPPRSLNTASGVRALVLHRRLNTAIGVRRCSNTTGAQHCERSPCAL
jgi:hypothetical protein